MKIAIVLAVMMAFMTNLMPAAAQPAHACGQIVNLSVVYATVDNLGIAPRPATGSEQQFNCIAGRDPNFSSFRTDSSWKAANYWFTLYSQELGVNMQPLPAPTN